MKSNKISIYMPLMLALMLAIGFYAGKKLQHCQDTDVMVNTNNKLLSVLSYIEEEYVDTVSTYNLLEVAIPSMLESLDPHSSYIPAKDLVSANESLEGNFSGIGVQFNMQNDTVVIIQTIPNGPSEKMGILAGDRIVKVNGFIVAGKKIPSNEIVGMLKGKRGTKVTVSILRRGFPSLIDYEITRDNIPLYSVDISYMINENIGYIKINQFSKTTYTEFIQAVEKLKGEGMEKMIIDLRGNGGGVMGTATQIANEFLPKGKLIVYTEGRTSARYNYYSDENGSCLDIETVVLMDEFSASASEILAGALQDNDRATIVGRRSFGKGLVQEQSIFSDGSAIRLTVARYYTPTGRCIQKPYENGINDYYNELNIRYAHGELEEKDSIQFNDTLKYVTPGGKIVYGGGGIMPDVFIPMDTIGVTNYYATVRNNGLIYRFGFEYADNNRKALSKLKDYQSLKRFLDKQNLLNEFVTFAANNGVEKVPEEIRTSEFLLTTILKAQIARNIIDNEGFYPILQVIDNALNKGIEILSAEKK